MLALILLPLYTFGLGVFGYYSYSRKDRPKKGHDRLDFLTWYIMNALLIVLWPVILILTLLITITDKVLWGK